MIGFGSIGIVELTKEGALGPGTEFATLPLLQIRDWCFPYAAPYALANDFRLLSCGPRVIVVLVGCILLSSSRGRTQRPSHKDFTECRIVLAISARVMQNEWRTSRGIQAHRILIQFSVIPRQIDHFLHSMSGIFFKLKYYTERDFCHHFASFESKKSNESCLYRIKYAVVRCSGNVFMAEIPKFGPYCTIINHYVLLIFGTESRILVDCSKLLKHVMLL